MQTEDGKIIQECLNGKPQAFGILVDKYKEGIYAFAYTELRDFQDAQDVTQEVFLQAYRNLHSLRNQESFAFWLYRIAYRYCVQWFRTRSKRVDKDFIEDQDSRIVDALSLDSYRESQLNESVREALDSLPYVYREVLLLHYFGGLTIKDIARAIGASPAAIGMRLSRARAQLKEEMIAMMGTAFEGQGLPSGFTFHIVEMVKRIKIHPIPRTAGFPWGLPLAAGIIIAILSIGSHLNLPNLMNTQMDSTLPGETIVTEVGEIPVNVLKFHRIPTLSSQQGNDYGGGIVLLDQQKAVHMAPRGEGDKWPEEPAARLGKGDIGGIAYSPDCKLLALAGGAGVWLYDADNLNEVGLLKGNTSWLCSVAFSPDGKLLASGDYDNTIHLWNVEEQKQVGVLKGHTDGVNSITFSPDGKLLASGGYDNTVRLWDVEKQNQVGMLRGHTEMVHSVAFSPDGKQLASSSSDNTIHLWDIQGKSTVGILHGHEEVVSSVAFSPDGKTLASGSWDNTARLWDVEKQKLVDVLEHTVGISRVVFSPDGKTLVSGSWDGIVRLWDVEEQKQVGELQGGSGEMWAIAFGPDGKILAAGYGLDDTVWLWDVQEQKQLGILTGYTHSLYGGDFSPDGELLASGSVYAIYLWDVEKQKRVSLLRGNTEFVRSVAFSPDGELLASGSHDETVCLWDVQREEQVAVLEGHTDRILTVAFSPDGKLLASASHDNTARLWDVEEQKLLAVLQHGDNVHSVAFSPDGELLASACWDKTIRLWDVETQRQVAVLQGHTQLLLTIAFSLDGKLLASGGGDRTVRLWDIQKQKQVGLLSGVYSLAFSPDRKLLASGSKDGTVRIWDVEKQELVRVLKEHIEHLGWVYFVRFTNDGKWFVSGSYDGTIVLWEVNVGGPGISVNHIDKKLGTWGEVKKTALLQNYPNPFNPETWIPFTLSDPKRVKIRIYTSTGQLVRTIDLGQKPSGAYVTKEKAAYWDGRNEAGETVASNLYFYAMEANGYTSLKKMVLTR